MGTRLALLALAVQFILSFAHVHGAEALAASASAAHASGTGTATTDRAATRADHQAAPAAPADSDHDHSGAPHHSYCAICGVIALANALLAAEPVLLHAPQAYHVLTRAVDAQFWHLAEPHGISQPRAPPLS